MPFQVCFAKKSPPCLMSNLKPDAQWISIGTKRDRPPFSVFKGHPSQKEGNKGQVHLRELIGACVALLPNFSIQASGVFRPSEKRISPASGEASGKPAACKACGRRWRSCCSGRRCRYLTANAFSICLVSVSNISYKGDGIYELGVPVGSDAKGRTYRLGSMCLSDSNLVTNKTSRWKHQKQRGLQGRLREG